MRFPLKAQHSGSSFVSSMSKYLKLQFSVHTRPHFRSCCSLAERGVRSFQVSFHIFIALYVSVGIVCLAREVPFSRISPSTWTVCTECSTSRQNEFIQVFNIQYFCLFIHIGHGPVVEDPKQKISAYIQHRLQREREILEFIGREGVATAMQITNGLYKVRIELCNPYTHW